MREKDVLLDEFGSDSQRSIAMTNTLASSVLGFGVLVLSTLLANAQNNPEIIIKQGDTIEGIGPKRTTQSSVRWLRERCDLV
jgi:hypothetical protein